MMSRTTRFTSGRVRLASARVKNLRDNDPLHVFGMWDEPHDFLVAAQHHDRRSHMVVRRVELLGDPEALQLRLGFYDGRVGASVIRDRAIRGIMSRPDTARHDVAV